MKKRWFCIPSSSRKFQRLYYAWENGTEDPRGSRAAGVERFNDDLSTLMERIGSSEPQFIMDKLDRVRSRLVQLKQRKIVKINHSAMELLVARSLIKEGYEVIVEHELGGNLICDLYATKGGGSMIVEVETGYTPPDHALDPLTYNLSRTASKVSRYSHFANKFALGTLPINIMLVDPIFLKSPSLRTPAEMYSIKKLCDNYYSQPPVSFDEIQNARLHSVYLIDVDNASVEQFDPETYLEFLSHAPYLVTKNWKAR